MTKSEVLEFLERRSWGHADRERLVELWNDLRGDKLGKIGMNNVRSNCRLKNVRSALLQFANTEMV